MDLFDKSGDYDLTFKIEEAGFDSNGNLKNAFTEKRDGANEWIVTIDDDYVRNATKLALARTIIHESIHAFIGYTIRTNNTSSMVVSLQSLYRHYLKNNSAAVANNLTEHQFIAQYVDALANSLAIWDNRQQSMNYYKQLSWAGLESSSIYQSLTSKDKIQIQKTIQNEATSASGAKGIKCN